MKRLLVVILLIIAFYPAISQNKAGKPTKMLYFLDDRNQKTIAWLDGTIDSKGLMTRPVWTVKQKGKDWHGPYSVLSILNTQENQVYEISLTYVNINWDGDRKYFKIVGKSDGSVTYAKSFTVFDWDNKEWEITLCTTLGKVGWFTMIPK